MEIAILIVKVLVGIFMWWVSGAFIIEVYNELDPNVDEYDIDFDTMFKFAFWGPLLIFLFLFFALMEWMEQDEPLKKLRKNMWWILIKRPAHSLAAILKRIFEVEDKQ